MVERIRGQGTKHSDEVVTRIDRATETPELAGKYIAELLSQAENAYTMYRQAQKEVSKGYKKQEQETEKAFKKAEQVANEACEKALGKALQALKQATDGAWEEYSNALERIKEAYHRAVNEELETCSAAIAEAWSKRSAARGRLWDILSKTDVGIIPIEAERLGGISPTTRLAQMRHRYGQLTDKKFSSSLSVVEERELDWLIDTLDKADSTFYEPSIQALREERDRLLSQQSE